MAAHQILETAAKNKDMTRAGVIVAANETVVDYQGLAPNQGYGGEVNDFIVRESYIFDIQADLFDAAATVAGGGSTGSVCWVAVRSCRTRPAITSMRAPASQLADPL